MSLRACAALVVAAALGGCQPSSNVCGHRVEKLSADGGEVYRCVRAEDCPRPAGIRLCLTDGDFEEECVSCDETECTQRIPERCQ